MVLILRSSTIYLWRLKSALLVNPIFFYRFIYRIFVFTWRFPTNCCIFSENGQRRGNRQILLTGAGRWLLQFIFVFGMFGSPSVATGFTLQRWFSPCNVATLGYFLFPECSKDATDSNWGSTSILVLLVICSVLCLQLVDGLGLFVFHLTAISFVQAYSFSIYLKYFQTELTGSLSGPRLERHQALRIYRELQILNRYYNKFQQNVFINVVLFLSLPAMIIGAYILIAFGSKIKLHEVFMFSCFVVDGLVAVLVVFSVMASVNLGAVKGIQYLRSKIIPSILDKRARKSVEMYLRSFQPLKVYIGEMNFVDKTTPFTLLCFCLAQIVNLLLLH